MSADESRLIPPDRWIPHPVSDHGDLDRPEPMYGEGLTGDARAEYDAAVAARSAHTKAAGTPTPSGKRKRRKRRKS